MRYKTFGFVNPDPYNELNTNKKKKKKSLTPVADLRKKHG